MRLLSQFCLCASLWGCPDNKVPADTSAPGQDSGDGSSDSADPSGGDPSPDTGVTEDADADADADTDADADADADADGGPTGCTSSDLIFEAEIRNDAGTKIYTGLRSDSVHLWAVVDNPCSEPVTFTTGTACLIENWRVVKDGITDQGTFPCFGTETTRTVPDASHIEQEVLPLHDLTEGTYAFTITYGYRTPMGFTMTDTQRVEADVSYAVVGP